jgi:hypothetical protein
VSSEGKWEKRREKKKGEHNKEKGEESERR